MIKKVAFCLMIFLFSISFVIAADVAYVHKTPGGIDQNIIDVFEDQGLSVETIKDSELWSTDFSSYSILFIADERFRNVEYIPFGEIPTISANYYHGEVFGLTDVDGVSQLASNAPLEVKKGNQVVQVYTQARFQSGGISIPYYYLSDENKVGEMNSDIKTHVGIHDVELGDVISYANQGLGLLNGKKTNSKVCFFGIIESNFWTPAAKDMFIDCVGFVGTVCSNDNECPDDSVGELYCMGGDVYRDTDSYECQNPATVVSKCVMDSVSELVQECDSGCDDGSCIETYECDDLVDNDNDLLIDEEDPGCWVDSSDPSSYDPELDDEDAETTECQDNIDNDLDLFIDEDDPGCWDNPLDPTSYDPTNNDESSSTTVCTMDSDCGSDGNVGDLYCDLKDIYQNYERYNCLNPGKGNAECVKEIDNILVNSCDDGCVDGRCIVITECEDDVDNDNDLLIDEEDPGCWASPNDPTSYDPELDEEDRATTECQDNIDNDADTLIDEDDPGCWDDISNPGTYNPLLDEEDNADVVCFNDLDCDDSNDYTLDMCINPGRGNSYCTNEPITCIQESDCGVDGFINGLFCDGPFNDDVYQDYRDWTCENPGTISSSCSQTVSQELVTDCAEECADGACIDIVCYTDNDCDDQNSETTDVCNKPGTVESYCSHEGFDCSQNSDCGSERYIGELYCQGDDVFRSSVNYSCNNPFTTLSYCSNSILDNFLFNCDYACLNGNCIRCDESSDCDDQNSDTFDICRYSGTVDSYCSYEEIVCSEASNCGSDGFVGAPYCVNDDSYQNFRTFSCNNPSSSGSFCSDESESRLIEDCSYGCAGGLCVDPVHDVALVDFNNAINDIRLEYSNGTDILEDPAVLNCVNSYKVYVNVENQGDFSENITFNGNAGLVVFNHNPVTLMGGDDSLKYKNVIFNLATGNYDLNVEAVIDYDEDLSDNSITREIRVICPVCYVDSDCDDNNALTQDACINPGLETAFCENNPIPIECSRDSDCGSNHLLGQNTCTNDDVYDTLIEYTCNNPGTILSECSSLTSSVVVEDCGEDSCTDYSENFCRGDDLYRERMCGVNGCEVDSCVSSVFLEDELVEECSFGCVNDECIDPCTDNDLDLYDVCNPGDPGDDGKPADCNDNNYFVNPGKTEVCNGIDDDCDSLVDEGSVCVSYECSDSVDNDLDLLIDEDDPGCFTDPTDPSTYNPNDDDEGDELIICSNDLDCGNSGLIGQEFCIDDDVYDYFRIYSCINSGTVYSQCLLDVFPEFVEECSYSCLDGVCLDECNRDSDCPNDYYGDNYCMSDDLYKDLHDFGCSSLECIEDISPELVEECSFGCVNAECIDSCVDNDLDLYDVCNPGDPGDDGKPADCDDNNPLVNPGATEICNGIDDDCDSLVDEGNVCVSYECSDSVDNDLDLLIDEDDPGCWDDPTDSSTYNPNDDDESEVIICSNDLDCGNSALIGNEYCIGEDVYDYFRLYSCVNPGTVHSECSLNILPELIEECSYSCSDGVCLDECSRDSDCPNDYYGDNYCMSDDSYKDLHDYSCSSLECVEDISPELVEECSYGCSDGVCLDECNRDSDCPNDYYGDNYCMSDDLYKDLHDFGCSSLECIEDISPELVEECSFGCVNAECIDSCVDNDLDLYDVCNPGDPGDDGKPADCDDNNPLVNPGATEVCNGIDDDCDSLVDEGSVCVSYECSDNIDNDLDLLIDEDDPGCWVDSTDPSTYNPNDDDENDEVIVCEEDLDCGLNALLGDEFCSNDDVYDYFRVFSCINAGTVHSECTLDIFPELLEQCSYMCSDGECLDECRRDSDCPDDFYSDNYCLNDDVFRDLNDNECEALECVLEIVPELVEECSLGCSDGICVDSCVDNDLDLYDVCNPGDPGDDGKPADCNDNNYFVNPGATEVCNGIDDDCDSLVDEGGVCKEICDNGLDDDGDGLIDGLNEESESVEETFGNSAPGTITTLVQHNSEYNLICPLTGSNGAILRSSSNSWFETISESKLDSTADKVCNILGYAKAVDSGCHDSERSYVYFNGKCNYHSPSNNCLYYWDGTDFKYTNSGSSKRSKSWITDLTCRGVISDCNDGLDNDDDGDIDYPEDLGCASPYDDSEIKHDPDCDDECLESGFDDIIKNVEDSGTVSDFISESSADKYEVTSVFHYNTNTISLGGGVSATTISSLNSPGFNLNDPKFTSKTKKRLGINGGENFDMNFDSDVYSFGWMMYEPLVAPDTGTLGGHPNYVNGVDSTFDVTLRRNGAIVDTFVVNSKDYTSSGDENMFFGIWLDEPFDEVEFRESGFGSNEWFGPFYIGSKPKC